MITVVSDLRAEFPGVRDQGDRPTCLAFATSAANGAAHRVGEHLSVEYLYYKAVQHEGVGPDDGSCFPSTLKVLDRIGQPKEAEWPYAPHGPVDASTWVPPHISGTLYRNGSWLNGSGVGEVVSELTARRPVLIGMSISNAFLQPNEHGVVDRPEPLDPARLHAVVAVGHGYLRHSTYVLVRNSWGAEWGQHGHAWLSGGYLGPRLMVAAVLA